MERNPLSTIAEIPNYLSKPFEEVQLLDIVSRWLIKSNTIGEKNINNIKSPLYNLSKIENIGRGKKEFIDKMVRLFINQTPISLKELSEAYTNRDFHKISKIVHRIKPSIENMGIVCIEDEIIELEKFSLEYGQSERAEYLLEKIKEVLNLVVHELQGAIKI